LLFKICQTIELQYLRRLSTTGWAQYSVRSRWKYSAEMKKNIFNDVKLQTYHHCVSSYARKYHSTVRYHARTNVVICVSWFIDFNHAHRKMLLLSSCPYSG